MARSKSPTLTDLLSALRADPGPSRSNAWRTDAAQGRQPPTVSDTFRNWKTNKRDFYLRNYKGSRWD